MEKEPAKIEQKESIENIDFKIVDKSEQVKKDVMDLLHEYPGGFVHGIFEPWAEKDFDESDVVVAYDGDTPVGCLMFNKETKEYNWLAVKRGINFSKTEIAKHLFESFYPTVEPGVEVHFFVNTEDASTPEDTSFSGKNFEPARNLYRSMGLEIKEANIIKNKYGPGAHAYRVGWVPNSKE